ncbi:peroxiredoxin-like family protein [Gilvimarinus xylanilyticus]|uniref:AhpC/TSA family protein n=1 Tax=Gilvimarinus xylanilyticus TaxID=2944139 RepID=A0A9X2KX37_9GAMM|nr:peroxiredoxin-like family protein [Gilvimarinus xylanilyticus]MCP8900600.1 AhpC/TSA family protein [Gilvimarinus xylanilyticus]
MTSTKLTPGETIPAVTTPKLEGGELDLSRPPEGYQWRLIVIYRGKHCPLCTNHLKKLNHQLPEFRTLGVDVVAVSADSAVQAREQMKSVAPDFEVGYGLSVAQMRRLGLYISTPLANTETDHPFAEPALFAINRKGELFVVDIANVPFSRPEPASILMGLKFILNPDNHYPIRGTH